MFPLITNDRTLSERELLLAYKGQPLIEKRFAQLKTDFAVAPVYLKKVGSEPAVLFTTKLSTLQKKILRLLGLPLSAYDA